MPEFRRDPLNHTWVVFAPERQRRPNEFTISERVAGQLDPFAVGEESLTPSELYAARPADSKRDGPGWKVRVVPNRYPALRIEGELEARPDCLYDRVSGIGAHEVIIETPSSELAFESLDRSDATAVFIAWRTRMLDLDRDRRFQQLSIFKNVGPAAGASLHHAHSQLVALPLVPPPLEAKLQRVQSHYQQHQRSLFSDLLYIERQAEVRMVAENESFVLFCPYASRFPFELTIYPLRHHADFVSCSDLELSDLAEIVQFALLRLNAVLDTPAYNLLLHTAPLQRPATERFASSRHDYSWSIEIVPRLAAIAGFELGLGSYINPVFPEEAARHLRGEAAL